MFLINKKFCLQRNWYRVKFNRIKKHLLLIKQKQKKSKRIWMKTCSKSRSGKSACANIFLELPLTIQFRHYLGMNATSCCWSYIDFYILITYNYILTYTYNSDTDFRLATLLKIDSYTGLFLWNLRTSEEHLFWRISERLFLCIDYFIIYWFLQSSSVHVLHFFTNNFFFITQLKQ